MPMARAIHPADRGMSADPVCHFCHNPMHVVAVATDDGPRLRVARCRDCDNIVPVEHEDDAGKDEERAA
jgi:hypothetical protein